jgi:hypothetical protein
MEEEKNAGEKLNENVESKFLVEWKETAKSLATLTSLPVVKNLRDGAVGFQAIAKAAKDPTLIKQATEARYLVERRAGELLLDMPKNKGGGQPGVGRRGKKNAVGRDDRFIGLNNFPPAKLSELGISKDESARWQKLATFSETDFADTVAAAQRRALREIKETDEPIKDSAPKKLERKRRRERDKEAREEREREAREAKTDKADKAEPEQDLLYRVERPDDNAVSIFRGFWDRGLWERDAELIALVLLDNIAADKLLKIMGLVADGLKKKQAESAAAMSGGTTSGTDPDANKPEDKPPPAVSVGNGKLPSGKKNKAGVS